MATQVQELEQRIGLLKNDVTNLLNLEVLGASQPTELMLGNLKDQIIAKWAKEVKKDIKDNNDYPSWLNCFKVIFCWGGVATLIDYRPTKKREPWKNEIHKTFFQAYFTDENDRKNIGFGVFCALVVLIIDGLFAGGLSYLLWKIINMGHPVFWGVLITLFLSHIVIPGWLVSENRKLDRKELLDTVCNSEDNSTMQFMQKVERLNTDPAFLVGEIRSYLSAQTTPLQEETNQFAADYKTFIEAPRNESETAIADLKQALLRLEELGEEKITDKAWLESEIRAEIERHQIHVSTLSEPEARLKIEYAEIQSILASLRTRINDLAKDESNFKVRDDFIRELVTKGMALDKRIENQVYYQQRLQIRLNSIRENALAFHQALDEFQTKTLPETANLIYPKMLTESATA